MAERIRDCVRELEPWRHNIDLGEFTTFEVAESVGPFSSINHPQPRAEEIIKHIPVGEYSLLDIGCNAGGISFMIEEERPDYSIDGVDAYLDKELTVNPLIQAFLCKYIRDSDVNFIEYDALEYLNLGVEYNIIIASGILYHIRSNGDRNTEMEKKFVDLIADSSDIFIIETDPTGWLKEYMEYKGINVIRHNSIDDARDGVRQFMVAGGGV